MQGNNLKRFFIIFFILLLLSSFILVFFAKDNLKSFSTDDTAVTFSVNKGDSLTTISNHLFEQKLIKNNIVFKYYGVYKKYDQMLKEGEYEISPSYNISQIYNILILGKQELISITIPEGYTSSQIATVLENKGVVKKLDFFNAIKNQGLLKLYNIPFDSAEGYLYPDTYSFQEDYPPLLVAQSFITNFFKNVKLIYPSYTKLTSKQLADKVILASIIEREYKSQSEAKTIASVFYNRLEKDIKLQSCATVMYVLTEELGEKHRNRLLYEDLEVESKFNTYLHLGLPPKAISNPGYVALEAAFHPESTDFIFFVVGDREKGTHTFSSKYSDHESASLDYISGFESKK